MTSAVRQFLFILGLLLLAACEETPKGPALAQIQGQSMGTSYSIKFIRVPSAPEATKIQLLVDQLLEQIESKMSTYLPDSEVSRFNQDFKKTSFVFSSSTAMVIEEALRIGKASEGALDITVGPLVELWGFGRTKSSSIPSRRQIALAQAQTGLGKLILKGNQALVTDPRLQIDLSAIAKGYAVDEVAGLLEVFGFYDYMVEIGGEIKVRGRKLTAPWRLGVEKPLVDQRSVHLSFPLLNKGMATSGDYRNFFERDGKRYSHTLDPATARPVSHGMASATVIHDSVMSADGWATAMMVLGPKRGLRLAERQGLAVYLLHWEGERLVEEMSTEFQTYLQK